jgi:uncharacterized membrane protein YidH (DUF202 family)
MSDSHSKQNSYQPPSGSFDPGLANERTSLSWRRTALSLAAIAAVLIRLATQLNALALPGYIIGGLLLVVAGGAWLYGVVAYRSNIVALAQGHPMARPLSIKVIAVTTTVTALAALALSLLPVQLV